MSAVPFPEMGVFFVSREPVRDPAPIVNFAKVRALLEQALPRETIPGSISCTSRGGFVIASCPEGVGRVAEASMVEVYEYDPVRYQANVVGLVAPPRETPIHWIARRVNPEVAVVCVSQPQFALSAKIARKERPKGYWGNADTLLALGRVIRGQEATSIDGVGLVVSASTAEGLVGALRRAAASH